MRLSHTVSGFLVIAASTCWFAGPAAAQAPGPGWTCTTWSAPAAPSGARTCLQWTTGSVNALPPPPPFVAKAVLPTPPKAKPQTTTTKKKKKKNK